MIPPSRYGGYEADWTRARNSKTCLMDFVWWGERPASRLLEWRTAARQEPRPTKEIFVK